jgi:transcriptional regulator with XRE-family HTH domain
MDVLEATHLAIVGENIRARRERLGHSQEAFARVCDLDRSYYSSVERGERNLGVNNLIKIAAALKCTMDELFRGVVNAG